MTQLTVGSLFSGIGGLDLGLERAGMRVIWQSEIDPFACRVLQKHWEGIPNHGDIRAIDWRRVERPAVICGGYPCQPFSVAGHRKGEDDDRHLWPRFFDAIRILRPRYALMENVRGHLTLGGTNVIADLASIRYDAEWRVVSASSVGANHRRERLFIVAYTDSERCEECDSASITDESRQHRWCGHASDMADTNSKQLGHGRFAEDSRSAHGGRIYRWRDSTPYDGWQWWSIEPGMDRVADGIPARVDRLRTLGNAVVPQIAEVIGRMIVRDWESRQ